MVALCATETTVDSRPGSSPRRVRISLRYAQLKRQSILWREQHMEGANYGSLDKWLHDEPNVKKERATEPPKNSLVFLTTPQLAAMGLDKYAVARRVRRGSFERILPEVIGIAGTPDGYRRDVTAAAFWGQEGSAASHASAATIWGLDGFSGNSRIDISTTRRNLRGPRTLPSGRIITVHRVNRRVKNEIVKVGPTPVTSVPWTILDLAGIKHRRLGRVIDRAIRDRLTDLGLLWLLYEKEWTFGRRGIAILREMLVDRTKGLGLTDSDLEDLYFDIVRNFELPLPKTQFPMDFSWGPGSVDFTYPDAFLAIECDSWTWHGGDRDIFDLDRLKDQELQAKGWVVMRLTWAQLTHQRAEVAEKVRFFLRTRAPRGSGRGL